MVLQNPFPDLERLDAALSTPTPGVLAWAAGLAGDVVVLGAAGKMGPTLARMAQRAVEEAGSGRRVVAVSRYSKPGEREKLEGWGVQTLAGDLLDESFVASLPEASDVVFMAGMKFGATGNESLTWAMNTLLPANVCRRYARSRIAAFSTGNVYGMVPLHGGGSLEADPPNPQGEYAMSCLGRERTFEHYSRSGGTAVSLLRLNYACELRYGVLVDLAQRIVAGQPIGLTMPMANVIWQRDANAMALQSLGRAASPPFVLNLAGPEQVSVERVARRLAGLMDKPVAFEGEPGGAAILSNGQLGHRLFGYPTMPVDTLIEHVAEWVGGGGAVLDKPTKFEVTDGKF